ncbi:MAG: hypothetical protein EB147_02750 [Acidimicrobiia bacterium]|nr:hypothetical protein [Actinomycetota bacterium]NDF31134.1 hypothetical protein [Acidimicrobiia bacterium]
MRQPHLIESWRGRRPAPRFGRPVPCPPRRSRPRLRRVVRCSSMTFVRPVDWIRDWRASPSAPASTCPEWWPLD